MAQWGKLLLCGVHGCQVAEVQSSNPGHGGLSVYTGQLSAYSENNISGRHRGFDGVLFNL